MTRTLMTGVYEHPLKNRIYYRAIGYLCNHRFILYQGPDLKEAEKARRKFNKLRRTLKSTEANVRKLAKLYQRRQWIRRV